MLIKDTLTAQEIFTYVLLFLRKQGVASITSDEATCAYRGENGSMCAVGCLISDDEYTPYFEGNTINALLDYGDLTSATASRLGPHALLLAELQQAHDNYMPWVDRPVLPLAKHFEPGTWEQKMKQLAEEHNLEYTELEMS